MICTSIDQDVPADFFKITFFMVLILETWRLKAARSFLMAVSRWAVAKPPGKRSTEGTLAVETNLEANLSHLQIRMPEEPFRFPQPFLLYDLVGCGTKKLLKASEEMIG